MGLQPCIKVDFFYHMHGVNMGSLSVSARGPIMRSTYSPYQATRVTSGTMPVPKVVFLILMSRYHSCCLFLVFFLLLFPWAWVLKKHVKSSPMLALCYKRTKRITWAPLCLPLGTLISMCGIPDCVHWTLGSWLSKWYCCWFHPRNRLLQCR